MRTLQGGASAITAGPHTPCLTLHQRVERFRPARKKRVTIAHAVDADVCKWDAETHLVSVAHAAASPFAKTPGRPRTGGAQDLAVLVVAFFPTVSYVLVVLLPIGPYVPVLVAAMSL